MKAPKCRSCGKVHWGVCDSSSRHVDPPETPIPVLKKEIAKKMGVCPHCGKGLGDPVAGGFDKKAYQREYMRRRRGKAES